MINYAVLGYEFVEADQLYRVALKGHNTLEAQRLREWADVYEQLCPKAGIRTAVAWAQACHETGWFLYSGEAKPEMNNPCGLYNSKRTDFEWFPSKEAGCRGHLGHILWYFGWNHPVKGFCEVDPRHEGILGFPVHKKLENDLRQLNGKWAVPGSTYGEVIGRIVEKIIWSGM